jgi:GT2 family glycosyltransferase
MSECSNLVTENQTIVILCYKRTDHLEKVLSSLEKALLIDTFSLVFVVQDSYESVLDIINSSKLPNKSILEVNGASYTSPAQAINGNLAKGLEFAFETLGSSLTIVLEDDIVVSKDALCYFRQIHKMYLKDSSFRGINGFSEEYSNFDLQDNVIKINYGLGWGWAIPQRTYNELTRYWSGSENNHWDFIFEPFIRTGFVINPYRSRVKNIGFDKSATHTSMNVDLGRRIELSFECEPSQHSCKLIESTFEFQWMGESVTQVAQFNSFAKQRFLLQKLLFLLYVWGGRDKTNYFRIRRRLLLRG